VLNSVPFNQSWSANFITTGKGTQIAVVIPTYKARNQNLEVINGIGHEVARITETNNDRWYGMRYCKALSDI
jgi:hypothetical protein